MADLKEIEENDFNLNVPRYVDVSKPEKQIDISKTIQKLNEIKNEVNEYKNKVNDDLEKFKMESLK